jgi:anti-sigma factor (TIGR02949 family)
MQCDDILRMLNDYFDEEIDPSVCETLRRHLEGCEACRVVVDTTGRTIRLVRDRMTVREIPIPFRERLHETLRARWCETHKKP